MKPVALMGGCHPREARVRPCGHQIEPQEGPQGLARADLLRPRVRAEARAINEAIGFPDAIQQVEPARALAEEICEVAKALGLGLRDAGRDREQPPVLVGGGGREMDMRVAAATGAGSAAYTAAA
jgi:hypothetical protein